MEGKEKLHEDLKALREKMRRAELEEGDLQEHYRSVKNEARDRVGRLANVLNSALGQREEQERREALRVAQERQNRIEALQHAAIANAHRKQAQGWSSSPLPWSPPVLRTTRFSQTPAVSTATLSQRLFHDDSQACSDGDQEEEEEEEEEEEGGSDSFDKDSSDASFWVDINDFDFDGEETSQSSHGDESPEDSPFADEDAYVCRACHRPKQNCGCYWDWHSAYPPRG